MQHPLRFCSTHLVGGSCKTQFGGSGKGGSTHMAGGGLQGTHLGGASGDFAPPTWGGACCSTRYLTAPTILQHPLSPSTPGGWQRPPILPLCLPPHPVPPPALQLLAGGLGGTGSLVPGILQPLAPALQLHPLLLQGTHPLLLPCQRLLCPQSLPDGQTDRRTQVGRGDAHRWVRRDRWSEIIE